MDSSGKKMIRVTGTTEASITEDTVYTEEVYSFRTVYYKGDLSIGETLTGTDEDGNVVTIDEIDGLTQNGTTWSLGKAEDVNANTVVLKVDGNLTIESGYTLTAIKSGSNSTLGLMIYCSETFNLQGNVDMSNVFCSAASKPVYFIKSIEGTFSYINGGATRWSR